MLRKYMPGLVAACVWFGGLTHAATLWEGGEVTFSKPNFADWTDAAYQDRINDNVRLTRADTDSLFNIVSEQSYDSVTGLSPDGTEWAFRDLAGNEGKSEGEMTASNYAALTFMTLNDALAGAVDDNIVGRRAVLHVIAADIYINITVTSWTRDDTGPGGGGVVYVRATRVGDAFTVPALSGWGLCLVAIGLALGAVARARGSSPLQAAVPQSAG